jgi:hypothetical protein
MSVILADANELGKVPATWRNKICAVEGMKENDKMSINTGQSEED